MPESLSTRQVADRDAQPVWRIRRLFEDGTLPEPSKFVGRRASPLALLPAIEVELRRRGWLPAVESEVSA